MLPPDSNIQGASLDAVQGNPNPMQQQFSATGLPGALPSIGELMAAERGGESTKSVRLELSQQTLGQRTPAEYQSQQIDQPDALQYDRAQRLPTSAHAGYGQSVLDAHSANPARRRPFTEEEDDKIVLMVSKRMLLGQIAYEVGRTEESVKARYHRFLKDRNISHGKRAQNVQGEDESGESTSEETAPKKTGKANLRWNYQQDKILRGGFKNKLPWEQIAAQIPGRTAEACVRRCSKLFKDDQAENAHGEEKVDEASVGEIRSEVDPWNDTEEQILIDGIRKKMSYTEIASLLPGRRAENVSSHHWSMVERDDNALPKRKIPRWTRKEDRIIINGRNNKIPWRDIVKQLSGRSVKAAEKRWSCTLKDDLQAGVISGGSSSTSGAEEANELPSEETALRIKKSSTLKWTNEGDKILVKSRREKMHWVEIAALLPGRSPSACRHRHDKYLKDVPNPDTLGRSEDVQSTTGQTLQPWDQTPQSSASGTGSNRAIGTGTGIYVPQYTALQPGQYQTQLSQQAYSIQYDNSQRLPKQARYDQGQEEALNPLSGETPRTKERHVPWKEHEDKLVIDGREAHMNWEDIARRLPGRSAKSVSSRYMRSLQRGR